MGRKKQSTKKEEKEDAPTVAESAHLTTVLPWQESSMLQVDPKQAQRVADCFPGRL